MIAAHDCTPVCVWCLDRARSSHVHVASVTSTAANAHRVAMQPYILLASASPHGAGGRILSACPFRTEVAKLRFTWRRSWRVSASRGE
jgi:hypothetical protein